MSGRLGRLVAVLRSDPGGYRSPGMLLAVPMLMVIKAICDHVEDLQSVGELLGD